MKAWLRGLHRDVSLLLANGHPEAWTYPVAFVYHEASFVKERFDSEVATNTTLLRLAVSTILGGAKAGKSFEDVIKDFMSWG